MKCRPPALLGVVVSLLVAGPFGCSSGPNVVAGPGRIADDPLPVEAYPQVVPLDGVERVVVAPSTPVTRREDTTGAYIIRVPLRSVVSYDAVLRYRFIYFDETGAEVDRDKWRQITVPARAAVDIVGQSLRLEAADWRLEIGRELQRNLIG
jgi:uncharacterized protein YcfL